jgi:REP element-mobilizing transposase RayT
MGHIVEEEWNRSAVIPNHRHAIVVITSPAPDSVEVCGEVGAHGRAPLRQRPRSPRSFIAGFKSAVTTRINVANQTPGATLWQRNYYEHILCTEPDCSPSEYTVNNPVQWSLDCENPVVHAA